MGFPAPLWPGTPSPSDHRPSPTCHTSGGGGNSIPGFLSVAPPLHEGRRTSSAPLMIGAPPKILCSHGSEGLGVPGHRGAGKPMSYPLYY